MNYIWTLRAFHILKTGHHRPPFYLMTFLNASHHILKGIVTPYSSSDIRMNTIRSFFYLLSDFALLLDRDFWMYCFFFSDLNDWRFFFSLMRMKTNERMFDLQIIIIEWWRVLTCLMLIIMINSIYLPFTDCGLIIEEVRGRIIVNDSIN